MERPRKSKRRSSLDVAACSGSTRRLLELRCDSEERKDRGLFFCQLGAIETLIWLTEAFELERNKQVAAWVKNDHLGYEIMYVYKGVVKKYRPDFLIRLATGKMLVLEVKGQDTQQDKTKREFLAEWVKAVNQHGGFGQWDRDVSFDPGDIGGLLAKQVADETP